MKILNLFKNKTMHKKKKKKKKNENEGGNIQNP